MLVKSFLTVPNDYEKTLKLRRLAAILLTVIGLVGNGCYFLLVPNSTLGDFAQGFYLGAANGILFGALLLLVRCQYLLRHPEQRRKAQVRELDEREQTIKNRAFRQAGLFTFFLCAAALFVALPLSFPVFYTLIAVMALYAAAFLLSHVFYSRKL